MVNLLSDNSRAVPRVVVAQRVIEKLKRGALLYPEPETGEALIGLLVHAENRPEPDIYILDTIGPGDAAVREWGMFEQGSDWQGDVFHWLWINWEAYRTQRRPSYGNALAAKWDTPLQHVGDWHKQPGDMIAPSGGDAHTARRMIEDSETPVEHLVAPIVTMYPLRESRPAPLTAALATSGPPNDDAAAIAPDEDAAPETVPNPAPGSAEDADSEQVTATDSQPSPASADQPPASPGVRLVQSVLPPHKPNALVFEMPDDGWIIRVDFWYMSKRQKRFVPIIPEVWDDEKLPGLPPIAWHLTQPRRFEQELALLKEGGYEVDVVRWDADGKPPFEICFSVYKPGRQHVILLVTSADYPADQPAVRIAPLVSVAPGEDVFEKLYEASWPVLMNQMPDWPWDSKHTLVELVWHLEKYAT